MFKLSKVFYVTLSFLIVLLAVVSARYTGYGQDGRIVGSISQPEPDPTVFRPTHEGAQFSELTAMELNDVGDHME